jgi:acyl carrier protein
MADEIDATIAEVLSLVLQRPVEPGEALTRADEPKWDSLRHLEIVIAVEEAFGVAFTADEIAATHGVADLRRKIEARDAA